MHDMPALSVTNPRFEDTHSAQQRFTVLRYALRYADLSNRSGKHVLQGGQVQGQ